MTMFSLILMVIIGFGIALFSQQNTQSVPVMIGSYSFATVPVYMVVLVSMLIGLIVAWILSMMQFISTAFTLREKESALSERENRVVRLEQEVAALKDENARLTRRTRTIAIPEVPSTRQSGFFSDIRERFATSHRKEAIG